MLGHVKTANLLRRTDAVKLAYSLTVHEFASECAHIYLKSAVERKLVWFLNIIFQYQT